MSYSLNRFILFSCEAVDMADECWLFRWKGAHYYFVHRMQKSIDLVRRVRSTAVEAVILHFVTRPSSFTSNWSWLTCLFSYSRFPYQENKINEWFDETIPSENTSEQRIVSVMNVDREGRTTNVYRTKDKAKFPGCLSGDNFEVFLHRTNHESALNIMACGIDLNKARKGVADFSDGDGYYLSNSFQGLDWNRSDRSGKGQAVLIYRVNTRELRGENNDNGLNLCNDESEWRRVVEEYRKPTSNQGKKVRTRRKLRKECKSKHFIEGPISSGSSNHPSPVEHTYQLCVRQENCAQLFDRSLHSVVFFEASER